MWAYSSDFLRNGRCPTPLRREQRRQQAADIGREGATPAAKAAPPGELDREPQGGGEEMGWDTTGLHQGITSPPRGLPSCLCFLSASQQVLPVDESLPQVWLPVQPLCWLVWTKYRERSYVSFWESTEESVSHRKTGSSDTIRATELNVMKSSYCNCSNGRKSFSKIPANPQDTGERKWEGNFFQGCLEKVGAQFH